jgi:tetratricopeptide (TPR) repeat protein
MLCVAERPSTTCFFDYLFIDDRERGFRARYPGKRDHPWQRCGGVQIDRPECGAGMVFYFDPETYLLRMTRAQLPIHALGDAVDAVAIYSKRLDVNGVRLLSREEEVNFRTGEVIDGAEWTSIEANTLDGPRIFEAPEVHPSGITAVVPEMLEQSNRSTPTKMMATYFAFRKSEEGKKADVVCDMNWLGYALLKVDQFEYALPVFLEITREQPHSADAHENLGEAYLQRKDREKAIAAFERAVKLGAKGGSVQRKPEG